MVSGNNEFGISHETELKARLGPVGIWWIGFVIGWTLLLFSGMGFLFYKRHAPSAKVRGIWVPFAAVIALHLYWCSVNLGYIYGPIFPGEAEFWVMGIYLPLGYALFHASNSRFLQVAQVQQQYATSFGLAEAMDRQRMTSAPVGRHKGPRWLAWRLRSADPALRLACWITCGMVVQLTLTVTMFLISRKYHPSFGIPGTETHGTEKEQLMQKGRGWEWSVALPRCHCMLFSSLYHTEILAGGRRLPGRSSGVGVMRSTTCGGLATSKTPTVGGCKPSVAVSLGKSFWEDGFCRGLLLLTSFVVSRLHQCG